MAFCPFFACTTKVQKPNEVGCMSTKFWEDFDVLLPQFQEFLIHNGLAKKTDRPSVGVRNFLMRIQQAEGLGFGKFELPPKFPSALCTQINSPSFYHEIFRIDTVLLESASEITLVKKPNLYGEYFFCLKKKGNALPYPINELMALRQNSAHFESVYFLKNLMDYEAKLKMDNPMFIRFLITEFFLDFAREHCHRVDELSSLDHSEKTFLQNTM